jgi:hypothetical protein
MNRLFDVGAFPWLRAPLDGRLAEMSVTNKSILCGDLRPEYPRSLRASTMEKSDYRIILRNEYGLVCPTDTRALIVLMVTVYLVGVGVALSPTIRANWNNASVSNLPASLG